MTKDIADHAAVDQDLGVLADGDPSNLVTWLPGCLVTSWGSVCSHLSIIIYQKDDYVFIETLITEVFVYIEGQIYFLCW